MSDTPETDELSKGEHIAHPTVWAFCRKFERERDEARATCGELVVDSNAVTLAQTVVRITRARDEQRDSLAPSAWTLDWQAGPYPHTMRVVLATDGESMYVATYTKTDGWQDAYSGEAIDYYITYWSEIPALPQV